jgi:hypothetical protein
LSTHERTQSTLKVRHILVQIDTRLGRPKNDSPQGCNGIAQTMAEFPGGIAFIEQTTKASIIGFELCYAAVCTKRL